MKCDFSTCRTNDCNTVGAIYCVACKRARTTIAYEGHEDQTFGYMSYAQTGEDFIVCNIIEKILGIENPTYLDIGAHHPWHISNTALLYKRGWHGVNVEANPKLMVPFYNYRSDDVNLQMGVVADPNQQSAMLHMYDWGSGRNSLVEGYMESDPHGPLPTNDKMEVPTTTINRIVEQYCDKKFPDFLSIDVEGLDCDVLESANFMQYGYPYVICVEALPYKEPERIIDMLDKKGFVPLIRLSINILFVRKDIYSLVSR